MLFKENNFLLVISILDDRGDSREVVMNTVINAGLGYFSFDKKEDLLGHMMFMPEEEFKKIELKKNEYTLPYSTYKNAKNFLRSDRIRSTDLIIIDVDWAPGTGNIDGITLSEIIHENYEFAKLFFTGSDKKIVENGIREKIPDILTQGKRFYPEIFLKPDDFENDKFYKLLDYTMDIFRIKRAKYLKENCHSPEIINLLGKSSLEGDDVLSIRNIGGYQKIQLKNIFFECHTSEQFKEELSRCYHANCRFNTMKYFWSNEDIKLTSHLGQNPFNKKAKELLAAGKYKEHSFNKATRFYYEEIKPELGSKEIRIIEEFFQEIENILNEFENSNKSTKVLNNAMSDIKHAGSMLNKKTRLYLNDLKKLFGNGDVQLSNLHLYSEWFCYVGDCKTNSPSLTLNEVEDDGVKGHLMTIWNLLSPENRRIKDYDIRKDFGLILLEIKGKLPPDPKHSDNGGAFSLHGSNLADRIMTGNNLKKIKELLPYYFRPFLVESFGSDNKWHCVCFSTEKEAFYEITNPEEFLHLFGLEPINQEKGSLTGIRCLLGIEKV